jgi:mannosyl-oligosaccharide glucosidase
LEGSTYNLGEYSIEITKGQGDHPIFSHPSKQNFDKSIYATIPVPPEQMWQAKGGNSYERLLTVDAILQEIADNAQRLVGKWGQQNAPPPANVYSLNNMKGGGLHIVQKTFIGDFEVITTLLSS